MFGRKRRRLGARLDEMQQQLNRVERHTDRMELILTVREPTSVTAADAYEGLRKQVVNSVTERFAHLNQLVEIDAAVSHGADLEVLAKLVDAWLAQAAVVRISDPEHPQADSIFEFVSDGGGPIEVITPAYVDEVSGRLVRPGRARRMPAAVTKTSITQHDQGNRTEESIEDD